MNQRQNQSRGHVRPLLRAVGAIVASVMAFASGAEAAIVANLEAPNASELASGVANVQGWAYPTIPGDEIEAEIDVHVDGQFALQVPCCSDRADVKAVHPSAPVLSGFSGAYNFQSLAPGAHTMEVHIYSKFGDHQVLSTSFTSESLGTYAFNKKLFYDDADAGHCISSNTVVNGETVARIVCSGVEFTNGAGFTEHCADDVEMTWLSSAQGFRVTKGCDFIDFVKPPPDIVVPELLGGN